MKHTRCLSLLAIAIVFVIAIACTSPKKQIAKAEEALRKENYVEAAQHIVEIEQREVDKLEKELKVRYNKVITEISNSGDEAAKDVLIEDFDKRF